MTDTHETIADIIAQMHQWERNARANEADYKIEDTCKALGAFIQTITDRLEAANKREGGDAAKLREALEQLYDQICHGETERNVVANRQMIRAALSAPPRNCDRFATVDEARKAYEEYRKDYIMRASNKFDFPMEFEAWLLAPATEKEGGDK